MTRLGLWLRPVSVAVGVGAVMGVAVGGVGARLAMRGIAVAAPGLFGVTTLNGGTIGEVTWTGTVRVLQSGLTVGIVGGLLYLAVRPLLPGSSRARSVLFSVWLLLVPGALFTSDVEFALLDNPFLGMAFFVPVFVLFGLALPPLVDRWDGLHSANRSPSPRQRMALVVFLLCGVAGHAWNLYRFATGRVEI